MVSRGGRRRRGKAGDQQTDAFSVLVDLTYRYVGERAFYVYYILLLGVFIYSLLGITGLLFRTNTSRSKLLPVLALVTAVHLPEFGYLTTMILGWNAGPGPGFEGEKYRLYARDDVRR